MSDIVCKRLSPIKWKTEIPSTDNKLASDIAIRPQPARPCRIELVEPLRIINKACNISNKDNYAVLTNPPEARENMCAVIHIDHIKDVVLAVLPDAVEHGPVIAIKCVPRGVSRGTRSSPVIRIIQNQNPLLISRSEKRWIQRVEGGVCPNGVVANKLGASVVYWGDEISERVDAAKFIPPAHIEPVFGCITIGKVGRRDRDS